MKAVIVNTFAKDYSTGKIAYGLYKFIRNKGDDVLLGYGQGKDYIEEGFYRIGSVMETKFHVALSRLSGKPGCYSTKGTKRFIACIEKFSPDVVFLFNLHGYYLNEYLFLDYLKKRKIRTVYVMLDEYPFMGKCGFNMGCDGYKRGCVECKEIKRYPASCFFHTSGRMLEKKKKVYEDFAQLTFVAIPYTLSLAADSTLLRGKSTYPADEAIDISRYTPRDVSCLKYKLNIADDKKVIVCIAVYPNERKGAQFFLEAARRLETREDIIFVHVGFGGERGECPKNYIPISYVGDQDELCEYYSLGDLFCFTSLNETLPSTCLEALSCGSPLLLFNTSGMPYIADDAHSTLVDPGDIDAIVTEIVKAPRKTKEMVESCRAYAMSRYDNQEYYKKLYSLSMMRSENRGN